MENVQKRFWAWWIEMNRKIEKNTNRQNITIRDTLSGIIHNETIFHTDCHRFRTIIAEELGLLYKIFNHSRGCRSENNTHTNGIEGF